MKNTSALLRPEILTAMGVLAAGLLLTEVNLLASRHYARWDISSAQRYSLSQASTVLTEALDTPVEIVVLLGSGDERLSEARQLLESYLALSSKLTVRYVDPDRDTIEYLALGKKYNLSAEVGASGVPSDAGFLITSGGKSWFVSKSQLVRVDETGETRSQLEAQLTEGIARVVEQEDVRLCFITGHGERSVDDAAPEGLLELQKRLTRSNITVVRVPLDVVDPSRVLDNCAAFAVVGPSRPWSQAHVQLLRDALSGSKGLVLLLDPLVSENGRLLESGLASIMKNAGAEERTGFVLEGDPALRLPGGMGEAFFATPNTHPLTRGLSSEQARLDARVLFTAASPLKKSAGSSAAVLFHSSENTKVLDDLGKLEALPETAEKEEIPLALAQELPPNKELRGARSVVVGSSNLAWNRSFREPALYGNRVFVENLFSWILDRPALVSVPERPPLQTGLNLTEESLSALLKYVLLYMPATAALSGLFVIMRRRRAEERSRPKLGENSNAP